VFGAVGMNARKNSVEYRVSLYAMQHGGAMNRGAHAHVRFLFQRLGRGKTNRKINVAGRAGVNQCFGAQSADPGAYQARAFFM
jgi:hypothetical protein